MKNRVSRAKILGVILRIMISVIVLVVVLLLVISSVVIALVQNYYFGKEFRLCGDSCPLNEYSLVPIPLPPANIIACLERAIKEHESRLNPQLNFNNARGKKLNSVEIGLYCPQVASWYLNEDLEAYISSVLKERVYLAGGNEQYRIFARLYDDDADFLNWHYDNNFTKGNRYTLVVPLLVDDCNTAHFQYRDRRTGKESTVDIPLGQGVLYNGSDVYHRITPQTKGCKRMVVIIPFYSNPSKGVMGYIREKVRNFTYKQLTL